MNGICYASTNSLTRTLFKDGLSFFRKVLSACITVEIYWYLLTDIFLEVKFQNIQFEYSMKNVFIIEINLSN